MNTLIVKALKGTVVTAAVASLALQIVVLPWLASVTAEALPEVAFLRWPLLASSLAFVLLCQVILFSLYRLLADISQGNVFSKGSLRWVDAILTASVAAVCLTVAVFIYLTGFVGWGPPWLPAILLMIIVSEIGITLVIGILRELLVKAADLRSDLDAVI